ncbi:MAG TPA: holo-ACP synthase [Methylomirabilota bacterium]|nr:holo-ACP synthase [Methylomirabilota bacterium]
MMIVGMGIDVSEVNRIREVFESQGERFVRRVYTKAEAAYCEQFKNKYERYAGRFAVKEAAMKALGTGWSRGVRWVDIEVVRQRGGRPTLQLHGEARKIADALGVKNIAISITHTSEQAFAQVIFEG